MTTLPDDWQSLVTAGLDLVQAQDRNRWALGDLAAVCETRYGQKSIQKLATEIRMPKHKTLYDYHRVATFYPISARAEYPLLSWSHYREAMRLENVEAALELLAEANDGDKPVAWLAREAQKRAGKPVSPEKLVDSVAWISGIRVNVATFFFEGDFSKALHDLYLEGHAVRVVVYAADDVPMKTNVAVILGGGSRERRIR